MIDHTEKIFGCTIVYAKDLTLSECIEIGKEYRESVVSDSGLARRLGAKIVIGEPEQLNDLERAMNERTLPISVQEWLADGERGLSSDALCKKFFGLPKSAGDEHPHDPADLRRCVLFLEKTKTHDRIKEAAEISPAWKALVDVWPTLLATLNNEMQKPDRVASETYKIMQRALQDSARTISREKER